MSRALPPLNALRAFEAAARHCSFGRAAAELNVTSAAISHHVKSLEEYLGVSLFERSGRGLRLSQVSEQALAELSAGFDALARGATRLRAPPVSATLRARVAPAFASRWLVPRLEQFHARFPDVDPRIDAQYELPDFAGGEAQVAVHFGPGDYPPGLRADRLLGVRVLPLCAPSYLQGGGVSLESPDDLRHCRLLHDDTLKLDPRVPDWDAWLQAAKVSGVDTSRGMHFSHALLALEAALDGQGVVLTYEFIARSDISAGRLLAPFDFSLEADSAYYVVSPVGQADAPCVVLFRDWLLEQTRALREGEDA